MNWSKSWRTAGNWSGLPQRLKPDVIIADVTMPLLNGLDAVEQLRRLGCQAKVVFLTMHKDPLYAARAPAPEPPVLC